MPKNIDIIIIGDNNLETVGGEQESTKIIIKGIKKDFSVGVIQPGLIKNKETGVNYYFLTEETRVKHLIKKPFSLLKYIVKMLKIIKNEKPKIIHTQAQFSFFVVSFLKKIKLLSNELVIIHTERGLYPKYSLFFQKIFLFLMADLNVLVTTTKFNMEYWKKAVNKKSFMLDYKVIENTAGQLFETFDESLYMKRKEKIVVGFSGRYADWKNWPLAVEISEKLNKKIGNRLEVKMTIGCLDKKSLRQTRKMFEYLKGIFGERFAGEINVDLEEMDNFYYDVDIFILTSKHNTESFGRTLVEAMSRKTVVLTTDAGGSVEVVGNLNNVFETADDFVNRIIYLLNDKNAMKCEKEQNLKRVRKIYSLENNIKKHLKMYDEIILDN